MVLPNGSRTAGNGNYFGSPSAVNHGTLHDVTRQQFYGNMNSRGTKRPLYFETLNSITKRPHFSIMAPSPLGGQFDANFMIGNDAANANSRTASSGNARRHGVRIDDVLLPNSALKSDAVVESSRNETPWSTVRKLPVRAKSHLKQNGHFSATPLRSFTATPVLDSALRETVDRSRSSAYKGIFRNELSLSGAGHDIPNEDADSKNTRFSSKQQHVRDMCINNSGVPASCSSSLATPFYQHKKVIDSGSNDTSSSAAEISVLGEVKKNRSGSSLFDMIHKGSISLARGIKNRWSYRRELDACPPERYRGDADLAVSVDFIQLTTDVHELIKLIQVDAPVVDIVLPDRQKQQQKKERWDVFKLDEAERDAAVKKMEPKSGRAMTEEYVKKFHIPIARKDLHTLYENNWLNDEVCNFYFELIKERNEESRTTVAAAPAAGGADDLQSTPLPKIHIFSTFFYKLYAEGGYARVKKWTKKLDLFAIDMVLIPINLSNSHWTIVKVDFRDRSILYYDSLSPRSGRDFVESVRKYIDAEHRDKKNTPFNFKDWTFESAENVPKQKNGTDCGVFMCRIADCLAADQPLAFHQSDMQFFRQRMACEILNGKLYK